MSAPHFDTVAGLEATSIAGVEMLKLLTALGSGAILMLNRQALVPLRKVAAETGSAEIAEAYLVSALALVASTACGQWAEPQHPTSEVDQAADTKRRRLLRDVARLLIGAADSPHEVIPYRFELDEQGRLRLTEAGL